MMGWLLAVCVAAGGSGAASWKPPARPNPQHILDEAKDDARAGRYELALAKHEWFHREALKHDPSLYGVRLSFALGSWKELAQSYPPALVSLKQFREGALVQFLYGGGAHENFHDFVTINETLGETARTRETFLRLDKEKPALAKEVYEVAEPSLVEAKEYAVVGRYLKGDERWASITYKHAINKGLVSQLGADYADYTRKSLTYESALLIALLVLNQRTSEADLIARKARLEWDDAGFQHAIDAALKGEIPPPYP